MCAAISPLISAMAWTDGPSGWCGRNARRPYGFGRRCWLYDLPSGAPAFGRRRRYSKPRCPEAGNRASAAAALKRADPAIASANPTSAAHELLLILVDDASLPADTRPATGRKVFQANHPRSAEDRSEKSTASLMQGHWRSRCPNCATAGNFLIVHKNRCARCSGFCPPKPIGPPALRRATGAFLFLPHQLGPSSWAAEDLTYRKSHLTRSHSLVDASRTKARSFTASLSPRVAIRRAESAVRLARAVWPLDNLSINSLGEYRCLRCAECRLVGYLKQREQYLHSFLCPDPAVYVLVGHDEPLRVGQADREHHPSASLELID